MALLNPPELRPSLLMLVLRYLDGRRAQRDQLDRLMATLAPASLAGTDPGRDVRVNVTAAVELGLIAREGDRVELGEGVAKALRAGDKAAMTLLRRRVFDDGLNAAEWPSQVGARDLTSALGWFLTFDANETPTQMEGRERSANVLQEADFGPRQPVTSDDDANGWPIGNANRWNVFRRWACSLGFAWVNPNGQLVPDPTPAIREALPKVLDGGAATPAREFMDALALEVPVIDGGRYRRFVESNWRRETSQAARLTPALTDALERLRAEGSLILDDRADAPRVAKGDGSRFSHVRRGRAR